MTSRNVFLPFFPSTVTLTFYLLYARQHGLTITGYCLKYKWSHKVFICYHKITTHTHTLKCGLCLVAFVVCFRF